MKQNNTMQRSDQRYVQAISIGNIAWDSLSTDQEGKVLGMTSRGMFIKTADKWLKFLSLEHYRGPLTINLPPAEAAFPKFDMGTGISISCGKILFQDTELVVSTQTAEVWQPNSPSDTPLPKAERQRRLRSLAKLILAEKSEAGLAPLLPRLLNFPSQPDSTSHELPALQAKILHLQKEFSYSPDPEAVIEVLGSGTGLTPSGDDFVIGLLLALNRWEKGSFEIPDLERFNQQIVEAAYRKTTTLSANLIECAAFGWGNERLITTLDWLMSNIEQGPIHGESLLSWGSSSGIDVFVGFVVVLGL
jgi:hypothetical protein